ncbi:hypothetical protein M3Y97_00727900 [Aphelenchoides bicaudatus]|nr:hypothetical protein M3Y97_00727900 [Aphelenchoides bicaudatus]
MLTTMHTMDITMNITQKHTTDTMMLTIKHFRRCLFTNNETNTSFCVFGNFFSTWTGENAKSQFTFYLLLTGKTTCDYSGSPSSDCAGLVSNFVKSCDFKVTDGHRTQMKFLLPSYTQFTDCLIGTRGDCDEVELAESDVVLQPYPEYYSIDKDLDRLLKVDFDPACTDDSVFLILTDVERSDLGYYPDVERLFRSNLNQTINNFNSQYFLHTVVIWLSSNMSDPNNWPPQAFVDYWDSFSNAVDFVELRLADYTDLEDYS